jgi:hypothetical protein
MALDMPPLIRPVVGRASGFENQTLASLMRAQHIRAIRLEEHALDPHWRKTQPDEWQQPQSDVTMSPAMGRQDNWDDQRPRYSRAGTPSDAVPALSKLEARIAMEPYYVHHYASARYASVSYLPWTNAERRNNLDVYA